MLRCHHVVRVITGHAAYPLWTNRRYSSSSIMSSAVAEHGRRQAEALVTAFDDGCVTTALSALASSTTTHSSKRGKAVDTDPPTDKACLVGCVVIYRRPDYLLHTNHAHDSNLAVAIGINHALHRVIHAKDLTEAHVNSDSICSKAALNGVLKGCAEQNAIGAMLATGAPLSAFEALIVRTRVVQFFRNAPTGSSQAVTIGEGSPGKDVHVSRCGGGDSCGNNKDVLGFPCTACRRMLHRIAVHKGWPDEDTLLRNCVDASVLEQHHDCSAHPIRWCDVHWARRHT